VGGGGARTPCAGRLEAQRALAERKYVKHVVAAASRTISQQRVLAPGAGQAAAVASLAAIGSCRAQELAQGEREARALDAQPRSLTSTLHPRRSAAERSRRVSAAGRARGRRGGACSAPPGAGAGQQQQQQEEEEVSDSLGHGAGAGWGDHRR
jgi:hypothetical protein